MIYGAKVFNNGKTRGYLEFATGKKIVLNNEEKIEFDQKIEGWQAIAIEQNLPRG